MASSELQIDPDRGHAVAAKLHELFTTVGIHGRADMPEDALPEGVGRGTLEHLLFITLTVSIDYQRDANALWKASREAFEDPETRYIFHPESVFQAPLAQLVRDLQKHGVSKKQRQDVWIWRTVALSFLKKWAGDPRNFLANCGWDAMTVLERLKADQHEYSGKQVKDYPFLSGNKIGPLWLRMLRDNVGETRLTGLDRVPIPVDVHVARATFALGVVRGWHQGALAPAFEKIREAWFKAVKNSQVSGRTMIALDLDEALWHLSKYGCTHRDQTTGSCPIRRECEMKAFCAPGRLAVNGNRIDVDT